MSKELFIERLIHLTNDEELAKEIMLLIDEWKQEEAKLKRECQKEGIRKAKEQGVTFGRPRLEEPSNFQEIMGSYLSGEINSVLAAKMCGMGLSTFYRRAKNMEEKKRRPRRKRSDGRTNEGA